MYNWSDLLKRLSQARTADEARGNLPAAMIKAQWLGHPGASEDQIQVAESRLGVQLPRSYREFLKLSNGWGDFTNAYLISTFCL